MKKLLIIFTLFSYLIGAGYSEGFKLYRKGKIELRKGNIQNANALFLQAKTNFEVAAKTNSSQAFIKLAELYCNGWGVAPNKKEALTLLNKAKKLGASFISDKCLKNLH